MSAVPYLSRAWSKLVNGVGTWHEASETSYTGAHEVDLKVDYPVKITVFHLMTSTEKTAK